MPHAVDSARESLRIVIKEIENLDSEGPTTYKDAVDEIRDRTP
jgi:hypothetical protein